MQRIKSILILFVLLFPVVTFAASETYPQLQNVQEAESQNSMNGVAGSGLRKIPSPGSDDDLLLKLQDENQKKILEDGEITLVSDEQKLAIEQKKSDRKNIDRKKTQVVVTTEAGDGLIKLAWKVLNRSARTDDKNIRFIVRYGIESENLNKSQQVGKAQEYVLRELKNDQPYYLQIVALDQEKQTLYKSEEIQVIPRPFDALGSHLEKQFYQKNITMQDKIEPEKFHRELKQFGYDFFKNSGQLSQAVDSLPANDEYLVGPGDVMKLSLWGGINVQHELTVDRNGEIFIPKVGAVKVWGLSFSEVKKTVGNSINRYFRNYEMNLSLGKLRTIQVYVVGEVESPGSYPINSLSTVINALAAAGGPSKNGSLRNISVSRGTRTLDTVDLYDMLLTGDRSKDLRLQNGDTIFVPVIGSVVAVAGEVRRPAIYEIKGTTNLLQMISMAGGITAAADTGRIQLERLSENRQRTVQDVFSNSKNYESIFANLVLNDRDMIKIFPVPAASRQVVTLKGNVIRAGDYQLKPGMRLKDIIPSAESLLPETYLESAEITRISPPDYRRELVTVNLRGALSGNSQDNILLQEQDSIKIFSRWDMVEKPIVVINGAVVNPGVYDYYPGMSVRDLVTAGGSAKRNAFLDKAELSRIMLARDKAESKRIDIDLGRALAGDPQHNLMLQQDDVLIIRSVADWVDATDKLITLKGEVRFPGVYTVARGEKLSSVIERAGGYTEKAYLFGAKFTRKSVQKQQQQRMDEIIIRSEKEIMQKQAALASTAASKEELDATKATLDGLMQSLFQMKKLKAEGRIVMRLSALDTLKKTSYDIELEGGDTLEIPQRSGVVHVMGQVYNSTSFVYLPDSSVISEYINKAGGATLDGDDSGIYVIRADGSVFSRQQSSFGVQWSDESKSWSFGGFMAKQIMPGDTIVVPQKLDRIAWMRNIKDITQILANVALTAGTILVGLK